MSRASATPVGRAFPAIVGFALRQIAAGAPRLALLAALVATGAGFGLLAHALDEPAAEAFTAVADLGLFGLVVPLGCLVVGDAALAAEIRAGTFPVTWLSPVRVSTIVLGRWLAGWVVAGVALGASAAGAALVAGSPGNATAAGAAAVAAAGAYVAVFVLVGATTRRAAVWSLALVFLGESLLGGALSGVAQYSPQWLGRGVLAGFGTGTDDLLRGGVPDGVEAVVRLALVTVVALALATWRLRHLTLTGSSD